MCWVVSAVGEQSDDDIVIEVHETKWWQKNMEVSPQATCFQSTKCPVVSGCACCIVELQNPIQSGADLTRDCSCKCSHKRAFAVCVKLRQECTNKLFASSMHITVPSTGLTMLSSSSGQDGGVSG